MDKRPRYRPRGYKVPPKSAAEIRHIAEKMRQLLGIDGAVFDVTRLVEHTLASAEVTYVIEEPEQMPGTEAVALPDARELYIRSDVYEELDSDTPLGRRGRFTIPHEIGHLVLHTGVPFARTREQLPTHKPYEDSEWQADTFAGDFVMPVGLVRLKFPDLQRVNQLNFRYNLEI